MSWPIKRSSGRMRDGRAVMLQEPRGPTQEADAGEVSKSDGKDTEGQSPSQDGSAEGQRSRVNTRGSKELSIR